MTTPREESSASRRLSAVWFADIVGFTRLVTENEPLALRLVEAVQAAATAAVEGHEGKVVKFMGDGVIAEFPSAEGAALAGIQLLLRFGQLTEDWEQGPYELRLGLHLGDITVAADGDIYGDGVNRASRLEGLAEPGTLLVSEDVYRQLRNRPDLVLTDRGTRQIKGYEDPLPVYEAAPTDELATRLLQTADTTVAPAQTTGIVRPARPNRHVAIGLGVGILSFLALGVWIGWGPGSSDTPPLGSGTSAEHTHTDSFSVAVLPFRFLSADESSAYIADGISEELIHQLSYVPELRVASRTSSFQYRDAEMDVGVLAARLGVFMVIEGSVQKIEDDLVVRAQLIDADHDGMQIWSQGWESKANDVLDLQGNIAQAVVDGLLADGGDGGGGGPAIAAKVVSPGGDATGSSPVIDPEAHDLLLRGRYELARGTPGAANTAADLFTEAIRLAPEYARAHLALAEAQMELGRTGDRPLAEMLPFAREHLEESLRLDPHLAQAHAVMASFLGTFEWDWESAEREFETALELAPTPAIHRAFAELLSARGRHDEALDQVAMALPGAVANAVAHGLALFRARSYESARVALTKALSMNPTDDRVRVHLARAQNLLGASDEARITMEGVDPASPNLNVQLLRARLLITRVGVRRGRGEQLVQRLRRRLDSSEASSPDAPYHLAVLRLGDGEPARALEALRLAFQTRSPSLIWLPTDPIWDDVRSTPQFQNLVQRVDEGDRTP